MFDDKVVTLLETLAILLVVVGVIGLLFPFLGLGSFLLGGFVLFMQLLVIKWLQFPENAPNLWKKHIKRAKKEA